MNIGILGYGAVAKELIKIIDKSQHKIFVWHRFDDTSRTKEIKKIWADEYPHEMVQKNMIDIVVDALGSDNDDAIFKSKWAIEKSLKNNKSVITCNKKLMDLHGNYLCDYAKINSKFYINSLVAHSSDQKGLGVYLDINNFKSFSSQDLFCYRGAGPVETAKFIYEEINKIGDQK